MHDASERAVNVNVLQTASEGGPSQRRQWVEEGPSPGT